MLKEVDQIWLNTTIEKIKEKMAWVSEKSKEKNPYTTVNGVHDDKADPEVHFDSDNGVNWWCNGFWAGLGLVRVYDELYPYRKTGISGYRKEDCTLFHRQYSGRWTDSSGL